MNFFLHVRLAPVMIAVLGLASIGQAQSVYCVRAGASGANNGSDWNNAFSSLPSSLQRGATYYIADGNYGAFTFDDPTSGTTRITIKKATQSDHGKDTGWQSSYGDGQAAFGGSIRFKTPYWTFDGQTGGGPDKWKTGFGFKINVTSPESGPGIWIDYSATNVIVRHFEVQGNGGDGAGGSGAANDGVSIYPGAHNCTISYAYIHDMGRTIMMCSADNVLFEYVYSGEFESKSGEHAEVISFNNGTSHPLSGGTVRFCIFTWFDGTGGVLYHGTGLSVYGNIFHNQNPNFQGGNGMIGGWSWGQFNNVKIYNNTFINSPATISSQGNKNGNVVQNNLFYDVKVYLVTGFAFDYNHYANVRSSMPSEPHRSSSTGDPLVATSGEDYRLRVGTPSGTKLALPYNVDAKGVTRGIDNSWDRGAMEFVSGAVSPLPPPQAPTGLRVVPGS